MPRLTFTPPRVGIELTTSQFYSHTSCRCAMTGLLFNISVLYIIKYITSQRIPSHTRRKHHLFLTKHCSQPGNYLRGPWIEWQYFFSQTTHNLISILFVIDTASEFICRHSLIDTHTLINTNKLSSYISAEITRSPGIGRFFCFIRNNGKIDNLSKY